jgi:hypothetical protein
VPAGHAPRLRPRPLLVRLAQPGIVIDQPLTTIAECLEHVRECEWYAARTNDQEDRKFLLRKAKDWTKLAVKKELEIRASAWAAA